MNSMKTSYRRLFLAAAILTTAGTTTVAQDLNSAYFTQDFMFRHSLNPAYDNSQGYAAIPILGNFNAKLQGNFGVGDLLYQNPIAGSKKTVTFMHPNISYSDAMAPFSSDLKMVGDVRLTLASVGFRAFGGYNTVEINEKTTFGIAVPKSFLEFAKGIGNKDYTFDNLGAEAMSYAEIALGHSRDIMEGLRVGAKLKFLIGLGHANLEVKDMHANLTGNTWTLEGQATGEINAKGIAYKNEVKEYKSKPGTYQKVKNVNTDDLSGPSGYGMAIDLGGIYRINEDLVVSAALTDLGFISWSNTALAETPGGKFTFDGFHDLAVKDATALPGQTFNEQKDQYADQLADFLNLEDKGDAGSKTTGIAATATLGAEYTLPVYRPVAFGLLLQRHFNGSKYSWNEARLSANYTPLAWLDGGISLGVNSFSTSMGWVINVHPKGFNFFVGMDHLLARVNDDMIPMSGNANLTFGFNITW